MRQSFLHIAMNHHPARPGQVSREDDIRLALGYRSGGSHHKRANRKSSRAAVCRILVLIAGGIIKLLADGMNKHGILSAFAVVDLWSRESKSWRLYFGRCILDKEARQTVG